MKTPQKTVINTEVGRSIQGGASPAIGQCQPNAAAQALVTERYPEMPPASLLSILIILATDATIGRRKQRWRVPLLGLALVGLVASPCVSQLLVAPDCHIEFADETSAREYLSRSDRFTKQLSERDIQVRCRSIERTKEDDYLELAATSVLPWTDESEAAVRVAITAARDQIAGFTLPLPRQIFVIRSRTLEEGGAAYCRRNAIVLPAGNIESASGEELERLLLHELFHIASRQDDAWRNRAYAVIGFQLTSPISLPPELNGRRLTNPDAPFVDCFIRLQDGQRSRLAAPVLFSKNDAYSPKARNVFSVVSFKLMEIEKSETGGGHVPVVRDGRPVLLDPGNEPTFFRQIGRNTMYIVHPDEILAENFVALAMQDVDLKSPEIVDRLRVAIKRTDGS